MSTKLVRKEVVELCEALGFSTASSWNRKRMRSKLRDLAEMLEDNDTDISVPDDHPEADRLNDLLSKISGTGGDVKLVEKDDEDEGKDTDAPVEEFADESGPDEHSEEAETGEEDGGVKPKPEKRDPKSGSKKTVESKNGKPKSAAGPEYENLVGVRSVLNRRFVAGTVIKSHDLSKGITDEMVEEVDKLYGSSNPKASRSQLTDAWHAINGYVNGLDGA